MNEGIYKIIFNGINQSLNNWLNIKHRDYYGSKNLKNLNYNSILLFHKPKFFILSIIQNHIYKIQKKKKSQKGLFLQVLHFPSYVNECMSILVNFTNIKRGA